MAGRSGRPAAEAGSLGGNRRSIVVMPLAHSLRSIENLAGPPVARSRACAFIPLAEQPRSSSITSTVAKAPLLRRPGSGQQRRQSSKPLDFNRAVLRSAVFRRGRSRSAGSLAGRSSQRGDLVEPQLRQITSEPFPPGLKLSKSPASLSKSGTADASLAIPPPPEEVCRGG